MSVSNSLTILDTSIRRDAEGRYCLNDLHKASGGLRRHQPSNWLQIKQTQELIEELTDPGIPGSTPVASIKGGEHSQGTFVVKELVYAYAMWISPAFHIKVIRVFDGVATGQSSLTVADPLAGLSAENRALVTVMIENAELKRQQEEQAKVQAEQGDRIKRIEAKQSAFESGHAYFTVIGYCTLKALPSVSFAEAVQFGKKATKMSKDQGILIDKVRDPRFGLVNAYHESVLDAVILSELAGS